MPILAESASTEPAASALSAAATVYAVVPAGFSPVLGGSLSGTMNSHESLEEEAVGEFACFFALSPYGNGLREYLADFRFVILWHLLEKRRHIALGKRCLRLEKYRAIQ